MTQENPEIHSPRQVTVGAVNWKSVLDFTQLFRGFRLTINPAKITLALLAILLIYIAGRTFDFVWGPQVYSHEIDSFQLEKPDEYRNDRVRALNAVEPTLKQMLMMAQNKDNGITDDQVNNLPKNPLAAYRVLKTAYEQQFHARILEIKTEREDAEKLRKTTKIADDAKSPAEMEQEQRAAAATELYNHVLNAKAVVGNGIFDSFLTYEIAQFDNLVDNTLTFVRIVPVRPIRDPDAEAGRQALSGGLISTTHLWRSDTIAGSIANMTITGPHWLLSGNARAVAAENADTWSGWIKMIGYRGLYLASLLLLAIFSLLVLAITGATLSRMSALELAGVERAPVMDAILFSLRRLWVFVKAPITPFLIVLVIGLLLAAVSLVGAVPYVGEIILGIFFIIFLVIAFVLMLLLLGILGGFNLLYPTIAVEGSDAFDAMSRSFAYVYARPWRLLFYSVIALIYGVITYLFVSFAVYLVLLLTHTFVGWGTNLFGCINGAYSGVPKLETMWPTPEFSRLIAPTNWYAMSWSEYVGSLFLHFWIYLLICTIGAYVISYYFSIHTTIYLLLRRSVDGQATTEVFTEDSTDPVEPTEPAPAPTIPAALTPPPPTPPAAEGPEQVNPA